MKSLFRGLEMKRSEAAIIKESLTSELMNCVKNVQLELAQKSEPLSQVIENSLCTVLEAIFMHGLKETLADRMSSVLGDPDQRPSPEFWSLLMIFSHSEVIKQITKLSRITNDIGRSRAWIRLSLNDGMLTSYLTMIKEDNKALIPYFKKFAFLRDLEVLSTAIGILQGLNQFSFSLPINSSVLNTWPNAPLLLAGLWTPPMKNVPVIYGMDIVKGIVDSVEVERQIPIPPRPTSSQSLYREEEEALKIILNTPIEGSPLQNRMYMDGQSGGNRSDISSELSLDSKLPEQLAVLEANEKLENVKIEKEEIDQQSVEESIAKVEEEKNTTLESYHKILDSYSVTSEDTQRPALEDIIQKFSPSENKAKSQTSPKSPILDKGLVAEDFVVIEERSFEQTIPEFKFLIEQLGKLMHEKGLIEQNFTCKECGQLIGFSFAKACVCYLTGCYYCQQCFKPSECVLPSKILHNWDFSPYPVSAKAGEFLKDVQEFPLFDVRRINPRLYLYFPEMLNLQKLRLQLNLTRIYLYTCHDDVRERLKRLLWPREYLFEHVHLYAIVDLLDIPSGKLADLLKRAIKMSIEHVLVCQLCSQKGYICEVCNADKVIYPFDIETTYRELRQ